jgi:hypothetical protein
MEDLIKMKTLATGTDPFASLSSTVAPDLFKKSWRINSTVAKATICLLAQKQPKSFISGAPIDLSTTLSAYNSRQFHHIYPKAYLGVNGIGFHEANVIANICMLTASDNNTISDQAPHVYFPNIDTSYKADVFERALVPVEMRDGDKPFSGFVDARAALLANAAERLILKGSE